MSALDNLGPHLLGRRPLPQDPRDYRLEDYLDGEGNAIRRVLGPDEKAAFVGASQPADAAWLDRPIRDLVGVTWRFFLQIWALVKSQPKPAPPSPGPVVGDVVWADGEAVLDQGQTPHCVGFAWAQYGNTLPVDDHYTNADGDAVYYAAKVIDGEPRAEDGSDTRSGVKAMVQRGRVGTYAFAGDTATITAWLRTKGPVVTGTSWFNEMFTPNSNGYLQPINGVAGGHEWVIIGHLPNGHGSEPAESYEMLNSWGSGWSRNGRAYIKVSDYAKLLAGGGDACAAVELS